MEGILKEPSLDELLHLAHYAQTSASKDMISLGIRTEEWVTGLMKATPEEVQLIAEEQSGQCNDRMRSVSLKHVPTAIMDYFYGGHRVPGLNVFANPQELVFTKPLDLKKARAHLNEAIGFQSVKDILEYMVTHDLDLLYLSPKFAKTTGLAIYG